MKDNEALVMREPTKQTMLEEAHERLEETIDSLEDAINTYSTLVDSLAGDEPEAGQSDNIKHPVAVRSGYVGVLIDKICTVNYAVQRLHNENSRLRKITPI